jgi:hypothetical protein
MTAMRHLGNTTLCDGSRTLAFSISLALIWPLSAIAQIQLIGFSTYYPGLHFSPSKSGLAEPAAIAVRSMDEWNAVWKELHPFPSRPPLTVPGYEASSPPRPEPEPAPFIDFTKFTLLMVASGAYQSSGHGVAITSVFEDRGSTVVDVLKTDAGKGCGILDTPTKPIALSLIPRTENRIVFDITQATLDCTTQEMKRIDAPRSDAAPH